MPQRILTYEAFMISTRMSEQNHVLKEFYQCYVATDLNTGWRCCHCDSLIDKSFFVNHLSHNYNASGQAVGDSSIPLLIVAVEKATKKSNTNFISVSCVALKINLATSKECRNVLSKKEINKRYNLIMKMSSLVENIMEMTMHIDECLDNIQGTLSNKTTLAQCEWTEYATELSSVSIHILQQVVMYNNGNVNTHVTSPGYV